ncbi:MAG: hypothetical protein US69_C0016G0017 [candidate division TM6 bacterium GW2011_GWF2_38_10]|nr:MAG: hypothetical protein US69_C0016G0017 [candidate division TM6 bacterium GW2011_GWF2_38_10]
MTIYDECIIALKNDVEILTQEQDCFFIKLFEILFPLMFFGNINWELVKYKQQLNSQKDILNTYSSDELIIIFWNYGEQFGIKTTLKKFLELFDQLICVAPDTFVFFPNYNCVVEFHHDGTITMGYSNETIKQ